MMNKNELRTFFQQGGKLLHEITNLEAEEALIGEELKRIKRELAIKWELLRQVVTRIKGN